MRAIAVVPVIFFHAGIESFSGGYVGVDVFFVISGYLITSFILTEMDEDTASLYDELHANWELRHSQVDGPHSDALNTVGLTPSVSNVTMVAVRIVQADTY